MTTIYQYVGPDAIRQRAASASPGMPIASIRDLKHWLQAAGREADQHGVLAATFVVDQCGVLRLAARGSEHVACAGGGPVLSAGEMFFAGLEVVEVSNQSTGYCPEPESWPALAAALDRLGLPHLGRFSLELIFRRCPACGQRNIVKDGWFVCDVCGAGLPAAWNFADAERGGS